MTITFCHCLSSGRIARSCSASMLLHVLAGAAKAADLAMGEELFLAEGSEEAHLFLTLLRDLLGEDDPPLIALFTIRSDAYEPL